MAVQEAEDDAASQDEDADPVLVIHFFVLTEFKHQHCLRAIASYEIISSILSENRKNAIEEPLWQKRIV